MKTALRTLLTTLATLALTAHAAQAWDFSYGYQSVYDANANQYVVGTQNVQKWTEWGSTPPTYWGPAASGTPGYLTMEFNFTAPTTEIFLDARLCSFNWSTYQGHYGNASLWASADGNTWTELLNCPTPSYGNGGVNDLTYAQDLPASLLGSTSLWVQVQVEDWGNTGAVADGQFSRNPTSSPGNVFELDAVVVPEPGVCQLGLAALGLGFVWARRKRA